MAPTLGYWKLRGLGHVLRMVLHYKEVEFENKMYDNPDDWFGKDKCNLGLQWPNMPYYIDGDVKLTETSAILAYLGRKHNLGGTTEEAKMCNDMALSAATFQRLALARLIYGPAEDYEKNKEQFLVDLSGKLEQFSKVLGEKEWFGGSEMVYADFYVYDVLDVLNNFQPGCVEKYDNLKAFMARIEALPTLQKFFNSELAMKKGPFTGPQAHWGGKVLA